MFSQVAKRTCTTLLLMTLAAIQARGQADQDQAEPSVPVIADEPKTTDPAAFLPKKLTAKATRDFSNSSLREVIAWLRDEQELVVLVDENSLAEANVSAAELISDKLTDDPIYLLLNRLQAIGLAWYFENDILHITSTERAEELATTLPHNVGDLLDAGYELDSLQDVIVSTIASDSWADNGTGNGVLNPLGDVLFVRQSSSIQRDVAGLLSALRSHARQTFVNDPPQHVSLREKLTKSINVDFVDVPLESAVTELAKITEADIRLDIPALREQRIREREPVSIKLTDRKLSTVLQALALNLKLTWILRDGVLWITTVEQAEAFQKTAVYDVRDLCRDAEETDALTIAIVEQTEPDSWSDNGTGEGMIQYARSGVLVIAQQERIQMAILELLESYRTALRLSKPRVRPEEDPNEVVTVYYRLHSQVAQDLIMLLPQLIEDDSWHNPDLKEEHGRILIAASKPDLTRIAIGKNVSTVQGNPGHAIVIERSVLILQHTRALHEQVASIIQRIEAGDSRSLGGRGGGFGGGGGGFGGGFFLIPPEDAPSVESE